MGLLSRDKRDPNVRLVAIAFASGIPFAAYLATASAHDFWLDSGEFTAQAIFLDIAHPPGHPLAGLLGKLFCLIPLGPLPLRVAIAQAACAAAAAGFLYSAIDTTVRAIGLTRDRVAVPIALGGTWFVACSHAWWFQAVRPEVYALQALLVCVAIERIVALEAAWPTHDVRPLYVACLALGLGLANHHLVAFLALPALAPTLARVFRTRGAKPLWLSGLAIAVGLVSYIYLPVRAATDPPLNLGDPTSVGNLFWVVSAQVYAHDLGLEAAQPMGERFADLIAILGGDFAGGLGGHDDGSLALRSLGVLGITVVALYAILRTPGARRIGVTWGLVLLVGLAGRAWMGSVRSNPDVLGYLMPGLAAVGAVITGLLAALVARLGHRPDGTPKMLATILAIGVAALGLTQLHTNASRSSLSAFHSTDDFDEERIRRLPPNAVVLVHRPETVFRHWAVAASERARPDVSMVPMTFLGYPGVVEALAARDPDLAELLRGYLLEGELRQPDLQSIAARRPLFLEMDVRVPRELYEAIVPAGLYYEVVDGGATDTDVIEASGPHAAAIDRLYAHLGQDALEDRDTRNNLLWLHYMDALYYASVGVLDPARDAIQRGLAIQPESAELRALSEVLQHLESGPIDITPYLVGAPRE